MVRLSCGFAAFELNSATGELRQRGDVIKLAPQMVVEASTESEWVAQHLEQIGHEVIVADPNYGPMFGPRSRLRGHGNVASVVTRPPYIAQSLDDENSCGNLQNVRGDSCAIFISLDLYSSRPGAQIDFSITAGTRKEHP